MLMDEVPDHERSLEERAYYASLLDNIEDGVIATDTDEFLITAWNRGAERLYGYRAEEVLGRPAREVATFPGDGSRRKVEQDLRDQGRTRIEFTAQHKDGRSIEVELIAVIVSGPAVAAAGCLGIHRDITDRKRLEARILEAREIERSRIARDLHDEALQALVDALLLATAVNTATPSRETEQLVARLRLIATQLRGAIYDLRLGGEDKPFPQLLEELVAVHREIASDREIRLEIGRNVPAGPLGSRGTEVLRIIAEALTNARRHGHAAHVLVKLSAQEGTLSARIFDDGRGFALSEPAPPGHRGITGMQERADLLAGRLHVTSRPGSGTSVRLQVPLDAAVGPA